MIFVLEMVKLLMLVLEVVFLVWWNIVVGLIVLDLVLLSNFLSGVSFIFSS